MIRLPTRYLGKALMPVKASRARRFIKSGKARIDFDRKLKLHYLTLLVEPSGLNLQEVSLGIDPGSTFDGFSIVSSKTHHLNIELVQRPKRGKNSVKAFKARQATNRRVRRSRLRHRPIRFSNRTKASLAPTIKANVDFREWLLVRLLRYFPISRVVVEDVKFNHFKSKRGSSFSNVELGKTRFYEFIKSLELELRLVPGFVTKLLRLREFKVDPKLDDKGSKSFFAHCLDSFVLAKINNHNSLELVTKTTFIEKLVKVRRALTRERALYKDKSKFYRLAKNGVKVYFKNISNKSNNCRVKLEGSHSNHPKSWIYLANPRSEKVKKNTARYGGTCLDGIKKFFVCNEWVNRDIYEI